MDTLLGIPTRGWIALSIWLAVLIVPWTYVLYFLRRIDRSGVTRWGAPPGPDSTSGDPARPGAAPEQGR